MDFTREQAKEILMREVELTQEIEELGEKLKDYKTLFEQGAQFLQEVVVPSMNGGKSNFRKENFLDCAQADEIIAKCEALEKARAELAGMQTCLADVRRRK